MAERKIEELELEELEQRIAPSITGTGGYEGQPGNQSGHHGGQNPVPAGAQPQPNG